MSRRVTNQPPTHLITEMESGGSALGGGRPERWRGGGGKDVCGEEGRGDANRDDREGRFFLLGCRIGSDDEDQRWENGEEEKEGDWRRKECV